MPHHRLTFRTDPPTCVTCGSKVRTAVQFVTEPCPRGRGVSQRVKWMTRNVAKWFCSGRSVREGELEGPEYGPKRRSSRLGG